VNRPQSGEASVVKVSTLSDAKVLGHQVETSQVCVGEKLLSLRQLIKYPSNMASSVSAVDVTVASDGTLPPVYYSPFCVGACKPDGTQSVRTRDLLGFLAPYFRFMRGSMRVRATVWYQKSSFPSQSLSTVVSPLPAMTGMWGIDASPTEWTWGGNFQPAEDPIRVTVPAWQCVPMVPIHYATSGTAPETQTWGRQPTVRVGGYQFSSSTGCQVSFGRQPADDFELLEFIGPPVFAAAIS